MSGDEREIKLDGDAATLLVITGGVVLAIIVLLVLSVILVARNGEKDLKAEINAVNHAQCVSGSKAEGIIFGKYNDFILSFIQHEEVSQRKDLADGLKANAANDAALAKRLKTDRLPVVRQNCSAPFLH